MRTVTAIVAGCILAAAVMIGSNMLLVQVGGVSPSSLLFLALTPLLALAVHVAAGCLAAAIARDGAAAKWGLMAIATLLMLSSVVSTWAAMPKWYSVAMLILAPVGVAAGAGLHAMRAGRNDSRRAAPKPASAATRG